MTKTAKTYGGALYDLAKEESLAAQILADLQLVVSVLRENQDYRKLLSEPSIPKPERKALLDEAWRESIHAYTLNFLKLLCDNDTIGQISDCEEEFHRRYNEDNGIMEIRAVCAVPLSAGQEAALCRKLELKTGKKIELHVQVDSSVLGSIRLELPDRQLDGTIRHHLDELSRLLQSATL